MTTNPTDRPVNDMRELYAVQHAITDAGGTLAPEVHKAIDELREVWDRELRRAQAEAYQYRTALQGAARAAASAVVAVAAPPTGQTALRDRIADVAVPFFMNFSDEEAAKVNAGELAAAVVPVLPPPADRTAVLREAADLYAKLTDQNEAYDREQGQLDEVARLQHAAVRDVVIGLRRLADEAQQQPDTEAHPAERKWAAELYDPLAEQWVPGTRYIDRDRAVNALAHAKRLGPTWKDGAPTERRLVRTTTTYTVEPLAALSAVPPQPEEKRRG